MSSVTHIELDTTPPRVTYEAPQYVEPGIVRIQYSVDEPGVVAADFDGIPVDPDDGEFLLAGYRVRSGILTMHTEDDVGNAAAWHLTIPGTGGSFADGGEATYSDSNGGTYNDGGGATYGDQ